MRTDIGKFTADTIRKIVKDTCVDYVDFSRRFSFFEIKGTMLTGPNGDTMAVKPFMEIVFADTIEIEPRGTLVSIVNVKFTDGSTLSAFQPAWVKG